VCAVLSLVLVCCLADLLQTSTVRSQQIPGIQVPNHRFPDGNIQFPQADSVEEQKRLRALNAERQKVIVADTEKLLKLAKELKQETSDDTSAPPSGDQLRKLAEIEKLARNVKEKMTYTMGKPSIFSNDPYSVQPFQPH
jgi:hypothetical protein